MHFYLWYLCASHSLTIYYPFRTRDVESLRIHAFSYPLAGKEREKKNTERRTWSDCTNSIYIFSCIFFPPRVFTFCCFPFDFISFRVICCRRCFARIFLYYAHDQQKRNQTKKNKTKNENQTKCWQNCKSRKEKSNTELWSVGWVAVPYYNQFWLTRCGRSPVFTTLIEKKELRSDVITSGDTRQRIELNVNRPTSNNSRPKNVKQ